MVRIATGFDSGSVEVVEQSAGGAVLRVCADEGGGFRQWFAFRAYDGVGRTCEFELVNAGECTYANAFEGYRAAVSEDGRRWRRAETEYDGEVLRILHTPRREGVYLAYFAPYGMARQRRVLREVAECSWAQVDLLGESAQGRSLARVLLGDPEREGPRVWITARQHPGESMAEWWAEGLLRRLTNEEDPVVRALLERATVSVVMNMNPDGSVLGHQRCNANGVDLNRQWREPSEEAPEVRAVREVIEKEGVALYLDVHGDERTPYCFLAGCEGNPGYNERLRALENCFEQALLRANEDFQDEVGYDRDQPGMGDLDCASNWAGERFECLSFTLEMPFKDNANAPDPERGWTPERSMQLGGDTVEAVLEALRFEAGEVDPEPAEEEGEEGEFDA